MHLVNIVSFFSSRHTIIVTYILTKTFEADGLDEKIL